MDDKEFSPDDNNVKFLSQDDFLDSLSARDLTEYMELVTLVEQTYAEVELSEK